MGRLKAVKPGLAVLAPRVGWLTKSEAQIDRERAAVNEGRAWYNTVAWRRLRWQVLVEALFTCRRCNASLGHDTAQLVCDHIVPHRGDAALFWDRANLQCLCKACHDGAKQREERGEGVGRSLRPRR